MFYDDLKPNEVGHGGPICLVRAGFIGGSVRARLQVSVCSGYDCASVVNGQTDRHTHTSFDQLM